MARSHPPALLTIAARTIREAELFSRGDRVLVAVSGGPDSMALLHVLAVLRLRLGHAVIAHGVDHGLRPEAAAELDVAETFARSIDVPFARSRVDVAPGGNLQARARAARYEALRTAAARSSCAMIATAHHREDRAETVLLRLLRGAGPRGLAVLPPRAGDLVRPFFAAPGAAIEAHLARHAIPFSLDPSNQNARFLRVRVRRELLPLLRDLSPGIDQHLCALADQLNAVLPALGPPAAETVRASRRAIEALVAARSTTARVALKGGLVARWDEASNALAVELGPPMQPGRPGSRSSEGAAGASRAGHVSRVPPAAASSREIVGEGSPIARPKRSERMRGTRRNHK